jgi:hypothetical protein
MATRLDINCSHELSLAKKVAADGHSNTTGGGPVDADNARQNYK